MVTDFTWDYRNRLTNVKHRAAIGGTITYEATYTYDVFDRRIGVLEDADGAGGGSSVQTWTVYDGANAWADFAANGSLTMRYLNGYGMDERYARIAANGDVRWYLTDLVNSVRQIAQTNGTVVYSASYSAFGTIAAQSGAGGDRFKYTGREWDAGTGQYFYRARYYGADVGRFRSEDPIGFLAGDVNLSRYVLNSPTIGIDPSGLQIIDPRPPRPPSDPNPLPPPRSRHEEDMDWIRERIQQLEAEIQGQPQFVFPQFISDTVGWFTLGAQTAGGIICEPYDWYMTICDIMEDPKNPLSYAGLLPGVPSTAGRALKKVSKVTAKVDGPIEKGIGGRGWRGDKNWRDAVKSVDRGGTVAITDLGNRVPTRQEALDLIGESGGRVDRIEGALPPPNPHQYPHINYTTKDGKKGTIPIQ